MCCTPAASAAMYLAYCPLCESFTRPALLPLADAEQGAGEHDHDRHHGEPTAEIHRASEEGN
jgi:hypothetical protein